MNSCAKAGLNGTSQSDKATSQNDLLSPYLRPFKFLLKGLADDKSLRSAPNLSWHFASAAGAALAIYMYSIDSNIPDQVLLSTTDTKLGGTTRKKTIEYS